MVKRENEISELNLPGEAGQHRKEGSSKIGRGDGAVSDKVSRTSNDQSNLSHAKEKRGERGEEREKGGQAKEKRKNNGKAKRGAGENWRSPVTRGIKRKKGELKQKSPYRARRREQLK